MCYSEPASWAAAGVGVSGMAFLYARQRADAAQDPARWGEMVGFQTGWLALVLMQFYEAIMWRQVRKGAPSHRSVERAAMVTNVSQPLALNAVMLIAMGTTVGVMTRRGLAALLGAYAVAAALWAAHYWNKLRAAAPTDCGAGTCRLRWDWIGEGDSSAAFWTFYLLALTVPPFVLLSKPLNVVIPVTLLATLWASSWLGQPVGSKWCFLAVVLPWVSALAYKPLSTD